MSEKVSRDDALESSGQYWLFANDDADKSSFIDDKKVTHELFMEWVEVTKHQTKKGDQMVIAVVLGTAFTKEGLKVVGEFNCAVFNLKASDELKQKYPAPEGEKFSFVDVKGGDPVKLVQSGSRIMVFPATVIEEIKG